MHASQKATWSSPNKPLVPTRNGEAPLLAAQAALGLKERELHSTIPRSSTCRERQDSQLHLSQQRGSKCAGFEHSLCWQSVRE
jgi:hypothetical protein